MPLPLYDYGQMEAPNQSDSETMHMGLWFERFFSAYKPGFTELDKEKTDSKEPSACSKWLASFARKPIGKSDDLAAKTMSVKQLATSQNGQTRIYHCEGNFVTGLGNPHPLENGFLWHHTLGLPYLPGSAVKGLVRALVETAYHGEDKNDVLKRWFGTVTKEPTEVPEQSGQFIFLDALPVKPCDVQPEVMTPHMGKWYEKGDKTPLAKDTQPGDWHSPVPVGYLVARNLSLQFAILPCANVAHEPGIQDELANVWEALDKALEWMGAGAKAAIGFGQFQRNLDAETKLRQSVQERAAEAQRAAAKRNASPIDQAIIELKEKLQPLKNIPASDNRLAQFWTYLNAIAAEWQTKGNADERQQLHDNIKSEIKAQKIPISKGKKPQYEALLANLLAGNP